ncbi:hypothetical protein DVH24_003955 [Malus domestica]|uniref:Uncharacterized protein n=1 Tax=Malus domestica TaxID=3750 RepID=A0A498KCQ1_MALDO|nr:hypothetical protein DVH24_003955 [Malus domestica]
MNARLCAISTSLLTNDLSISNIKGNIPVDIGNFSNLIDLSMGNNQLSGAIPTSIQRLQNLQGLYLNDNDLGGHIPYELCQLYNLAELILGGNLLSGYITSCLGTVAKSIIRVQFVNFKNTIFLVGTQVLNLNLSSNSLVRPLSEDIRKFAIEKDKRNIFYLHSNENTKGKGIKEKLHFKYFKLVINQPDS